jgi:hypothetical protein
MIVMIVVMIVIMAVVAGPQPLFLGGMLGFLAQQGFAILARDLVIIRVDFAEGQEAVAVAAIVDEGRLERRLHPGHLGEVDVALELLVLGGFEVELLDPVTFDYRNPSLFRVARVDQHAHCHRDVSTRAASAVRRRGARAHMWTAARRRQSRRARGRRMSGSK